MNKMFSIISAITVFAFQSGAMAASLEGEFSFGSRTPQAGLVFFTDDHSQKTNKEIIIDQINQEFTKKLVVGYRGEKLTFKNSDSMDHNIYGSEGGKVLFDMGVAQPNTVHSRQLDWEDNKVVALGCKIHSQMQAWIASVPTPYYKPFEFKKGQRKVKFSLENFPDNLSKLRIWLSTSNFAPVDIELKKGEKKEIKLGKLGTLTITRK